MFVPVFAMIRQRNERFRGKRSKTLTWFKATTVSAGTKGGVEEDEEEAGSAGSRLIGKNERSAAAFHRQR
jgi:hypothetical protein